MEYVRSISKDDDGFRLNRIRSSRNYSYERNKKVWKFCFTSSMRLNIIIIVIIFKRMKYGNLRWNIFLEKSIFKRT